MFESKASKGRRRPGPGSAAARAARAADEPMTPKRLRAKAIDLLSRRDHSEKELGDKLRSRGGEPDDVTQLIGELRDIGLLDDRRFAQSFMSFRSDKAWGRRRYRQELISRGVDKELVDQVLLDVLPEDAAEPEGKLQFLVARYLDRGKDPQKVMASLVRRGFGYSEVQDVIRRLASQGTDEFSDGD